MRKIFLPVLAPEPRFTLQMLKVPVITLKQCVEYYQDNTIIEWNLCTFIKGFIHIYKKGVLVGAFLF